MSQPSNLDRALTLLLAIEKKEGYCHILLNKLFNENKDLKDRDKAFIKRLCEGVLEKKLLLMHMGDRYTNKPLKSQKPLVRVVLLMGIYQLLFMDSIKDYTAVNESVNLAKKHGFKNLSGFINGVLRKVSSQKQELLNYMDELSEGDDNKALSLYYSIPLWIIELWEREYPQVDIRELVKAIRSPSPITIRLKSDLNPSERDQVIREISLREGPEVNLEDIIQVSKLPSPGNLDCFKKGLITIQDKSSYLAVKSCGIKPGDLILDVCAAPGGKSALAAELTGPEGRVVAMDISPGKMPVMEEGFKRLGLSNVALKVNDASKAIESLMKGEGLDCTFLNGDREVVGKDGFDLVICDVPCSGLGVISRKKDICYRVVEEDIDSLTAITYDIVKTSVRYVKNGGRLLYSTCTISARENRLMVQRLQRELSLKLLSEEQLLPNVDKTDGFYYALFEKHPG